MTNKTPAEIEIEKLEKEIEELKKGCNDREETNAYNARDCGEFTYLCDLCKARIETAEAKLSGLKQGIELGRKESEEEKDNLLNKLSTYDKLLNSKIDIVSKTIIDNLERENNELKIIAKENKEAYNFKMLECVDLKLKFEQQLSNQKKEIIEKIEDVVMRYAETDEDGYNGCKEIQKIFDNQHKINNDEGDSCLSASADRKPEEMSVWRNVKALNKTVLDADPSGFSTHDEIIKRLSKGISEIYSIPKEIWDKIEKIFINELSLKEQEVSKITDEYYNWMKIATDYELKYRKLKELLSSLQEKIEKLPVEIKGEEDDVIMIKQALEIYKKSILKIFKEMGQ